MSDLTDRIADVLKTHVWYFVGNLGVPGMPDRKGYKCGCGWETRDDDGAPVADPHAHVAAAVVEELGLKEKEIRGGMDRFGAVHIFPADGEIHRYISYTSKWMLAE